MEEKEKKDIEKFFLIMLHYYQIEKEEKEEKEEIKDKNQDYIFSEKIYDTEKEAIEKSKEYARAYNFYNLKNNHPKKILDIYLYCFKLDFNTNKYFPDKDSVFLIWNYKKWEEFKKTNEIVKVKYVLNTKNKEEKELFKNIKLINPLDALIYPKALTSFERIEQNIFKKTKKYSQFEKKCSEEEEEE